RRAECERSLRIDLAHSRRGEIDEIRNRARSAFLCEPDQVEQDLRRCLRVGEGSVARARLRSEEVRERCEPGARSAAGEQATGETDGVDDRRCEASAGHPLCLAVQKREIEAGVVRDQHRVARELEEAADRDAGMRLAAELGVVEPRDRRNRGPQRNARVDEELELLRKLEVSDSHRADFADAGASRLQSGRLEVDDHERGVLEEEVGSGWIRQPDRVSTPREAGVSGHHLVEERPRQPHRCVSQRKEPARCLLGVDRAAPLLDELHEPVRRIEAKLHAREPRRTYVRLQGSRQMTLFQLALPEEDSP
ncbi:MAG: hypothetical protein QOD85_996, partial [Gaiellaceae bacterium]|nr:hypothetical protein [Gaiellaceae bacterium]